MVLHKRHPLVALTLGLVLQPPVLAQQREAQVEEIVVTPSRVPLATRRVGISVAVMEQEEIQAHGNLSLVNVLRQMPSIATSNSGGPGKPTSLRIRGEEGYRTITLFDGIRLSDPAAPQIGPQMEHLLSSGVTRIEVLRGPQGLAYGADAGGIVNITSRHPGTGLFTSFDAQTGAFGTRRYSGNVAGATDRLDYFLNLSDYKTDGFNARSSDLVLRDDDGYANTTAHGRLGMDLSDSLRLELVHRRVTGETEYDGCFGTTAVVHDCRSDYDSNASRLALDYQGRGISHSLSWAATGTQRRDFIQGAPAFGSDGDLERVEYLGSATALPGFDLVFGADWQEAQNGGIGRHNRGYFLEYLSDFSDRLFLTAGVRHDDNDDFGTNDSYRASAAYLVGLGRGDALKFRTGYGTGFRAPSPYEIAYNAGPAAFPPASTLGLQQEVSRGLEMGVEYLGAGGGVLEAVWFDQQVDDAIYFDLDSFSGYLQDTGTSRSRGVELSAQLPVSAALSLTANYTYNDTERPNGVQRPRRPRHLANLGATWFGGSNDRLNFNAFLRLSRDALDDSGGLQVPLDDFRVLDLSARYRLTETTELYGRLENALDEEYQEITGYRTPGRAAYVGFKVNFPPM